MTAYTSPVFVPRDGAQGLQDMVSRAETAGGITWSPITGLTPTEGFAVSTHPECETVVSAARLSYTAVWEFLQLNWHHFSFGPLSNDGYNQSLYFGAWWDVDSHNWYMDISTVVSSKDVALDLARAHSQLAVFDLSTGLEIRV